jgi:hypothetical protein
LAGLLPGASQIPALALTQATLLEVEALRRGDTSPVIFGLLAGHLCVDPGDKADYLMVDEVVRSRTSLSADDPTTELATEIRSLAADVLRRDKLPIGWYLEGMAGDVAPDPELRDLHADLFPEPWQFLLLRDDGSQGARGALIRIEFRAVGNVITASVNDEVLVTARDDAPTPGAYDFWSNYGNAPAFTKVEFVNLDGSTAAAESTTPSVAPPSPSAPPAPYATPQVQVRVGPGPATTPPVTQGRWSVPLSLPLGDSIVTVQASDAFGTVTTVQRTITIVAG